MRSILLALFILLFTSFSFAQNNSFPQTWVGHWKGDLHWFKAGEHLPQVVNMELRIQPADSTGVYTWQIIYGTVKEDNRPYLLKPKDPAKGHWVIDEQNGIVLDQFWVANRFSGAFTVQRSTIINSYWMEGDQLLVEFFSIGAKPLVTTGEGTDESPKVDSYRLGSYQKAVLRKTK